MRTRAESWDTPWASSKAPTWSSPRSASAFSSFTTICSGVCFENFLMVIHSSRPQTARTTQNNPLKTNGPKNPDPSRASNGPTEAINGIIELGRRAARGYRNPTNYQLRMLLITGGLDASTHTQL